LKKPREIALLVRLSSATMTWTEVSESAASPHRVAVSVKSVPDKFTCTSITVLHAGDEFVNRVDEERYIHRRLSVRSEAMWTVIHADVTHESTPTGRALL
jgi:hypothetical protein